MRFYRICWKTDIWSCLLGFIQCTESTRFFKTFLGIHQKLNFTPTWNWEIIEPSFEYNSNVDNIPTTPGGFSPLCFTCNSIMPRSPELLAETQNRHFAFRLNWNATRQIAFAWFNVSLWHTIYWPNQTIPAISIQQAQAGYFPWTFAFQPTSLWTKWA